MKLLRFEEESALEMEYETEALDASYSVSDDDAALITRNQSLFNWKSSRSKDVFGWLDEF